MMPISDTEWFAVREAARCGQWLHVVRFAERRGAAILGFHARRLLAADPGREDEFSLYVVVRALLLDRPDEPDPFADDLDRLDTADPRALDRVRAARQRDAAVAIRRSSRRMRARS
jgi:hypothetical protein